ncbi:hypothetical protein PENTCL1PPCAC_3212, partial [Pristionchus entomophagus]
LIWTRAEVRQRELITHSASNGLHLLLTNHSMHAFDYAAKIGCGAHIDGSNYQPMDNSLLSGE